MCESSRNDRRETIRRRSSLVTSAPRLSAKRKSSIFTFEARATRSILPGHPVHAHTQVPGTACCTKAFYFTGTVAISVNTIKPRAHVRTTLALACGRSTRKRGTMPFTNEKRSGREREKESEGAGGETEERREEPPGLVRSCRWKASLYGLSFMPTRKYCRPRPGRERENPLSSPPESDMQFAVVARAYTRIRARSLCE